MLIQLRAGENLWGSRGTHVCDEKGFAVVLAEDMEVEIDDDVAERAWDVIRADRDFRGVNADTGLPFPEPQPEPQPEPLITEEPIITEEVPNA
jgi:hypothetical protein